MSSPNQITIKQAFSDKLFSPVNNSPLILFRFLFGALLFYQFFTALFNGHIFHSYIEPPFTFSYIGFEFLQPLPGNGMYFYFGLMAFFSLCVMLGAWYRISMIAVAGMWTVLYLMQKADYNNHYYLMLLLCWIMVFLPANRLASVDVKRAVVTATDTCYQYCIWIFIAQMAIVYFFAGISKLSPDWLSGKFIEIQFSRMTTHQYVGIIYQQKWFQLLICYAGLLFDLLIVPLLIWKPTRNAAFLLSCIFHLFNAYTFQIGIFPYLAIALNVFFLDGSVVKRFFFRGFVAPLSPLKTISLTTKKITIYVLVLYFLFQLIIPMRSWFFPGNVYWTEEGYRMSWKMMIRTKSGNVFFKVKDPATGQSWKIDPKEKFSASHMLWLSISPDIIWQYAQRIKKDYQLKGYNNVEVYAIGWVSLNRGKAMPMVDTSVNLANVKWESFRHSGWITERPAY